MFAFPWGQDHEKKRKVLVSVVSSSATPQTVAHQAHLSMEFSRQEYWSRLPSLSPGNLPDPGIESIYLTSPALTGGFFSTKATWKARKMGLILWPGERGVWGCGEQKVQETPLKFGKLCNRVCSFKAEDRRQSLCLRNLPFVRITPDMNVSASYSPSSPQC